MSVVIRDFRTDATGPVYPGTVEQAFAEVDPTGWALVSWDLLHEQHGFEMRELFLCGVSANSVWLSPGCGLFEVIVTPAKEWDDNRPFLRFLVVHEQWALLGPQSQTLDVYYPPRHGDGK
jgi:hypothetical protein